MADKKIAGLLEKVSDFLKKSEWQKADEYCDKVLDTEPENAEAYLGKLMADLKVGNRDDLKNYGNPIENSEFYEKALSFADDELSGYLIDANKSSKKKSEEKKQKNALTEKVNKKFVAIVAAIIALAVIIGVVIVPTVKKSKQYNEAVQLMEAGKTQDAMFVFKALDGFKDSEVLLRTLRCKLASAETVSAGVNQIAAVRSDGKVAAVFDGDTPSEISGWSDIIAVSSGNFHTVGLKSDGTVVATGFKDKKLDYGQCNVSEWTDIISVSAGKIHTVGLKGDGTVVAAGYSGDSRCDVAGWTDIVSVSAGVTHTVALRADGTVVAVGDNSYNQCDVSDWTDIVAVSAGEAHTVGLKADGTVVVTEYSNGYYRSQSETYSWTDITAVAAGCDFTVGIKSDGTVIAIGSNKYRQIDVEGWTDIVAVSAGERMVIGLKSDGTVVCTGGYVYSHGISEWKNIKIPE